MSDVFSFEFMDANGLHEEEGEEEEEVIVLDPLPQWQQPQPNPKKAAALRRRRREDDDDEEESEEQINDDVGAHENDASRSREHSSRAEADDEQAQAEFDALAEEPIEDAFDVGWRQEVRRHKKAPSRRVDDDDEVFTQAQTLLGHDGLCDRDDKGKARKMCGAISPRHGESHAPMNHRHATTRPEHSATPRHNAKPVHAKHKQQQGEEPRRQHLAAVEERVLLDHHYIPLSARRKAYSLTASVCRALKRGDTPASYSAFECDYQANQRQKQKSRQCHTAHRCHTSRNCHRQLKQEAHPPSSLATVGNCGGCCGGSSGEISSPAYPDPTMSPRRGALSPRNHETHASKRPKVVSKRRPSTSTRVAAHDNNSGNNRKWTGIRATPKFPHRRQGPRATSTDDCTPTATTLHSRSCSGRAPLRVRKLMWPPR